MYRGKSVRCPKTRDRLNDASLYLRTHIFVLNIFYLNNIIAQKTLLNTKRNFFKY